MFHFKDVNVNYEYIDNKKNKTLVFLHGWGQNIAMMIPIAKPFTKDFNILILDLPGFGKSTEPKDDWSLDDYSEMLHALITDLKLKNLILIGHSFGGKISMVYASKHMVEKLVLLSAPHKGEFDKIPLKVRILKKLAKIPGLKTMANYFKKHMGSND